MRGDVDGDGKITENDRNRINEHLGGTITLTGADSWCAKVTGNNEISVSDLVQLMQYLEGKTNNLTGIPTFADYYNNWTYHKVDDLTGYWTAEIAINGLKTTSDAIVNIGNDEGIFYKSELSDGAIHFYATRPPIAEVSATITFKSGTGVITTSYESAKFHAATHSKDGADPITPESIGALSLSGGTMTGPLTLSGDPTGDLEATTKQYVDNHTSDTVLYTPQTLSAEQQAQARENINAAPGGFGLGSAYTNYIADFNACIKNGWYKAYSNSLNSPSIGGWDARYGALLVSTRDSVIYHVYYVDRYSVMYTLERYSNDGGTTWSEWEYLNPPMELGVEYRTTERYLGKPVYVKLINCGNLPNGTTKEIAHGITNLDFMVGAQVIASNSTSGFNGHAYLPEIYNGSLTDRWTNYLAGINTKNIRIFCGGGLAGCLVYVTFKYTKTTD